jgi:Mor family transcriptional regulator
MIFDPDYPELLADAARHLRTTFIDIGLSPEQSEFAAREAAEFLRLHWGGQQLYFAKGVSFAASQRDEQVWRDFNGRNVDELAKKYELSTRMVLYIVERMRELERSRRQLNLSLEARPSP